MNPPSSEKSYAFHIETQLPYDEAVGKVRELLKEEGFGVLTEIDVRETLKKKIDVDFKPYIILGACNPPIAYRALSADLSIGALLPCNVIVWDEGTHRVVTAMEPNIIGRLSDNPTLADIASQVSHMLHRAIGRIETTV